MMKKPFSLITAIALCLFLGGCGYTLVGMGSALPDHIHTLAIPVLKNESSEPEIHRDLTNTLIQAFINDGRLKIAKERKADLLMRGTLNHYSLRPVAFDDNDVASEYVVELGIEVKVTDQVKNKKFLKQNLTTRWEYKSESSVINTETARLEALEEAYEELASRLVSLIIERF